jgi:hypothetical protein
MEQFIIKLKDKRKRDFFLQLINQLEFVEVVKSVSNPHKAKFMQEFIESFEEVKSHQRGKVKLKSLDQLLNEL